MISGISIIQSYSNVNANKIRIPERSNGVGVANNFIIKIPKQGLILCALLSQYNIFSKLLFTHNPWRRSKPVADFRNVDFLGPANKLRSFRSIHHVLIAWFFLFDIGITVASFQARNTIQIYSPSSKKMILFIYTIWFRF